MNRGKNEKEKQTEGGREEDCCMYVLEQKGLRGGFTDRTFFPLCHTNTDMNLVMEPLQKQAADRNIR